MGEAAAVDVPAWARVVLPAADVLLAEAARPWDDPQEIVPARPWAIPAEAAGEGRALVSIRVQAVLPWEAVAVLPWAGREILLDHRFGPR